MRAEWVKGSPFKITIDHLRSAAISLEENTTKKLLLVLFTNILKIKNAYPKLSKTGLRVLLKKVINYSYKRSHNILTKIMKIDSKRDFEEAAYIQLYLEIEGYNIIFANEFHINMRSQILFNWSSRWFPSMVVVDTESFFNELCSCFLEKILRNFSLK